MANVDFECIACGDVVTENFVGDVPASIVFEHGSCPSRRLRRVWSPPSIGRGSSGGTPAR